jgi:hypothetical protein
MHFIYARNNWNADWELVDNAVLQDYTTTDEELGQTFTFTIPTEQWVMNEGSTATNRFRMYSEIALYEKVETTTVCRMAGFITRITPRFPDTEIECRCYLGSMNKTKRDCGHFSALIKKVGTTLVPIELIKQVEDGEDRYIIDPVAGPTGYTNDTPVGPPYYNRRTWKAIGRIRDMGTQYADPDADNYYPDNVLPPAKYSIGSDLLNYLQFQGYIPLGTITCEFVVVYEENTNQLEDMLVSLLSSVDDEAGPRLIPGVHFNNTSADYYVRTIWPSGITVNEWQWEEKDGTVAEAIVSLLQTFAPPNYKVFQDGLMVRAQYVEQTPHDTTQSYYTLGSYAYGRIDSIPPATTDNDYIPCLPDKLSAERSVPRDEGTFASRLICYGKNEYPNNMINLDTFIFQVSGVTVEPMTGDVYSNNGSEFTLQHVELITGAGPIVGKRTTGTADPSASGNLVQVSGAGDDPIAFSDSHCMIKSVFAINPAFWTNSGAGWAEDTVAEGGGAVGLSGLLDLNAGTYHRVWYDHNYNPPELDYKTYQPLYFIDFGWTRKIELIRLIMLWSRVDWKFPIRVECHSQYADYVFDPDSPWEPLHSDLYEMEYDPYKEVVARGQFLVGRCRFVLVSMKPTKCYVRYRHAAGLSDMEFIEREDVKGTAYIVHEAPTGAGWTHISGGTPGDPGEWYQHTGVGTDDGEVVCIMPLLYEQLLSRADDANKTTIGHRTETVDNGSLSNTNSCAMEAARVLLETLRDARPVGYDTPCDAVTKQYMTHRFFDPYWNTWRRFLVQRLTVKGNGIMMVEGTMYGSSETDRGGAWTEEVPNGL